MTKDEVREKVKSIFGVTPSLTITSQDSSMYGGNNEPYCIHISIPAKLDTDFRSYGWINGTGNSWDQAYRDLMSNLEIKKQEIESKLVKVQIETHNLETGLEFLRRAETNAGG